MKAANRGASVRARLLNRARADRIDFNMILTRYSLERLLYRLSVSPWADQFLLKGALLFDLWFDQPHRPTRDIDLLGFGSSEIDDMIEVFQQVCVQPSDDGIIFDQGSVQAGRIRKEANYEGVRVTLRHWAWPTMRWMLYWRRHISGGVFRASRSTSGRSRCSIACWMVSRASSLPASGPQWRNHRRILRYGTSENWLN
jgi:hypothetical protein